MTNKVFLAGKIADEPSARQTAAGAYVCNIILSVRRRNDKNDERTDNIACEAWGNIALYIVKSLKKGDFIEVEGSLRVKKKYDADGNTERFEQIVRIDGVEFYSG